jgi:lysophospholipase L1-like esterase
MKSGKTARGAAGLLAAGLTLVAGCHSPSRPTTVVAVQPLSLTCPATITIDNVATATEAVTFAPPGHSGGVEPVALSCSPASGANFPLGTTMVTCNGIDATATRTAACTLTVSLTPVAPVLGATTLLAVGDSITAGENGIDEFNLDDPRYDQSGPCVAMATTGAKLQYIDYVNSYPSALGTLLAQRYPAQTPALINCGKRGQTTAQGLQLLSGPYGLAVWHPDALLILEGINDLRFDDQYLSTADTVVANLSTDIQTARSSVKKIFLSTLIPQKAGARGDASHNPQIEQTNVRIRALTAQPDVVLVDSYAEFLARSDYQSALLESDGEHCTPEGYLVIAKAFFAKIQATLDQTKPSGLSRATRQSRSQPIARPMGVPRRH